MAAKRVATTALDWSVMGKMIGAEQKNSFNALKAKVDKHLRVVNSLPGDLPKIDFSMYTTRVAVPGMVASFEKSYAGLQIPYPADQGRLAEIDAQGAEQKQVYTQFVADSNTRIAGYATELAKWEAMKPVEEMNMEEGLDAGLPFIIDPAAGTAFPHNETWEAYEERVKNSKPEDWGEH